MVTTFAVGDLVWAKMKGFPPWPASVTSCSKALRESTASNIKYTVTFFGTRETAQIKAAELFPYLEHRLSFEKSRKVKGFNEGIKEIRCAAGLEEDEKPNIVTRTRKSSKVTEDLKISTRIRKPSSRISTEDFILPSSRVKGTSKSIETNQNSPPNAVNNARNSALLQQPAISNNKRSRLRTESNCSNGSSGSFGKRTKRVSYSDKIGLDFGMDADPILNTGVDPVFMNACLASNSISLMNEQQQVSTTSIDDVAPAERTRARRRTRSRFLDDLLMSPGKSPFRDRSRSISSNGGRSRLVSGYSDNFEDLLDSAHSIFNPNDLMAAIDQLPSEDSDRPLTPEEPLPMPAPLKTCYSCGCQCELFGLKWRCTSKLCMKWNGTHKPYPVPFTSDGEEGIPEKSSEQLEIEKAVNAIKEEASNFEEYNQQRQQQQLLEERRGQGDLQQESYTHHRSLSNDYRTQFRQSQHHASSSFVDGYTATTSTSMTEVKQEEQLFGTPENGNSFAKARTTPDGDGNNIQFYQTSSFINTSDPSPSRLMMGGAEEMTDFGMRKKSGRPKSYKVEKTPPIRADGRRLCALCNGEVRPQMCGGNKHRWRCVDKKCRKWYGWVLSCDEIPMDLGKKGRWKDLVVKVRQPGSIYDEEIFTTSAFAHLTQPKRIGRPPKVFMEDDPNRDRIRTKFPPPQRGDPRFRRKYTKKKRDDDIEIQRPISPLTLRQMSYEPSAIERHSRWWLVTRKRTLEMSPPRDFPTSIFSNAATLRLIGSAMLTAAETRSDEPGTVGGTLDLLLDALTSSIAPLLSLVNKLPAITMNNEHSETIQKLWKASSVHTPMF